MGQQVLDIEDAADIIDGVLIDGNTRVIVLDNALQHLGKAGAEVKVDNVLTARHNLLGRLVAEAHDALQHVLLVLQFLLVCQLQRLLQVVDTQDMALVLNDLAGKGARANQDIGQWTEDAAQKEDGVGRAATEGQCMLAAIDLRHNLAEEQQQERQQHGDTDELQPIGTAEVHRMREEIIAEHDDGDVHQVVGNQNRRQGPLRVVPERQDFPVVIVVALFQLVQIGRREREECYLRA